MGRPRKNPLPNTYSPEGSTIPPQKVPELVSGINEDGSTNFTINTQDTTNMSEEKHPLAEQIAKRTRDPQTGLLPGYNYTSDEFGRINWFDLIPIKYFYARKEAFPEGTDISSLDVSALPPDKRVLNLDGIKFLMDVRGVQNVTMRIGASTPEHASVEVKIDWVPCVDQGLQPFSTIGSCDAHAFNNVEPFKYALTALAENKALSRAVRAGTFVKTYSADELRGSKNATKLDGDEESSNVITGIQPINVFRDKCKKHKVTFEQIKNVFIKEGSAPEASEKQVKWKERAEKWTSDVDIVPEDILEIIARLDAKAAEKTANATKNDSKQ